MKLLDSARIEWAVKSYDWWLDLRGAPRRRRRELRRELRANLYDAAAGSNGRSAVTALGGTRRMAAEAISADPRRARWTVGMNAAVFAAGVVIVVEFLAALAWMDGAMAAHADALVVGTMTLFPGSSLEYARLGRGFEMTFRPGWLSLAIGLMAFLAVARPWRALRRATPNTATSAA